MAFERTRRALQEGWQAPAGILLLAAIAGAACSSDPAAPPDDTSSPTDGDGGIHYERDGSTYDSAPPPDSGLGELRFMPNVVYSGFDGTHTFQVPIAVYDADSDLTVTSSDPTMKLDAVKLVNPVVDGVTDLGAYYLVTIPKAGSFTLTATSKGRSATATVNAASYAADRWAAGETRYTNASGTGLAQPCTNCHVKGQAIDHSPAVLATATDQEISVIITTGVKPGPSPILGVDGGHKWQVTAAERDGLITYLRGLSPRGFQ
ncbi:hypothetical protein AKJ09_10853 [Labilithrix luteola]|uniref:Cytochrome c domain-containing protein n=1 Tax=Labilithrix luteola TaxID=1391654 RepID=A0A0K1QFI4_9BACT|nr:hypothetical protein [Labilithrix luteola]AKV04190.1 hypothetical protein AKJ09_10853 [Labilithrix luteola]